MCSNDGSKCIIVIPIPTNLKATYWTYDWAFCARGEPPFEMSGANEAIQLQPKIIHWIAV